jgi:DNA ligase-1
LRKESLRKLPKVEYNIDLILDNIEKSNSSGSIELMLAKKYEGDIDPKGWFMSEKLDGVRCYWNGSNMYSRNGNLFYPPDWFKKLLPKDIALDGELWTKRDDF